MRMVWDDRDVMKGDSGGGGVMSQASGWSV